MSRRPSPLAEALAAVAEALEELGLRWYIFGAQAAIVHGAARLSADLDVTVELGGTSIAVLVGALLAAGCQPQVEDAAAFLAEARALPLIHAPSRFPVDVVLCGLGLEPRFRSLGSGLTSPSSTRPSTRPISSRRSTGSCAR